MSFSDIKCGDVVVAVDLASHDYTPWIIKVNCIEYDDDFVTDTNPTGKHCYGDCLNGEGFEDYITNVDEANFVRFADEEDLAEIDQ